MFSGSFNNVAPLFGKISRIRYLYCITCVCEWNLSIIISTSGDFFFLHLILERKICRIIVTCFVMVFIASMIFFIFQMIFLLEENSTAMFASIVYPWEFVTFFTLTNLCPKLRFNRLFKVGKKLIDRQVTKFTIQNW